MQKLFNVQQIRSWDETTILNEPIHSVDLMERAATRCAEWIRTNYVPSETTILVVAGTGNNGGDGLAIARMLHGLRFTVKVAILGRPSTGSPDFRINLERLQSLDLPSQSLQREEDIPLLKLDEKPLLIDAIFGSGLSRPVEGWRAAVLNSINQAKLEVISIDLPSGLPADPPDAAFDEAPIIEATYTLTFQQPKLSCLFAPWGGFCGHVEAIDIGLDHAYEKVTRSGTYLLERSDVISYLPMRPRFSHKGTYGKVLIAAGSRGMVGAAVLSVKAALRSGVGLTAVHLPGCGVDIVQSQAPEAIVQSDAQTEMITAIELDEKVTAVAVGPGMGVNKYTAKAVDAVLGHQNIPIILDADALNLLAEDEVILKSAKAHHQLVLTPHPGEFDRLFGKHGSERDRVDTARNVAVEWNAVIVLKGAYSKVILPDGNVIINSTGAPVLATGGSGDVLTGLIGGLLAQGIERDKAALIGVFLHGFTGQLFEEQIGERGFTAGWLAEQLPQGWKAMQDVG